VLQPAGVAPTVPLSKPSLKNTPAGTDELPADEELATEDLELELDDIELEAEERTELEDIALDTEDRTELDDTDEERTELAEELTEDVVAPQTVPVTCGTSAVAPVLLP
jgi:hypothetical protein